MRLSEEVSIQIKGRVSILKIFLGMLLVASLLVIACASISLSVTNSWADDYLVVVIAGAVAFTAAVVLIALVNRENWNRELENADTANTEFRDLHPDN